MQGLWSKSLCYNYSTLQFAQTATGRLALELVLYQHSVGHQRILTEEISSHLGSLLKEWRVVRDTNSHLIANNTTISFFAKSPTEWFATQDKSTHDFLVVCPHISRLEKKHVFSGIIYALIPNLKTRCHIKRNIETHRNIIYSGVFGYNTDIRNTIQRLHPTSKRMWNHLASRLLENPLLLLRSST